MSQGLSPQPRWQSLDPAAITPGFWATCATATPALCGTVSPAVQFAGRTFKVEFVVEPTGLPPQIANGYTNMPFMLYAAFVDVQLAPNNGPNASELNVEVESTLRKVGS